MTLWDESRCAKPQPSVGSVSADRNLKEGSWPGAEKREGGKATLIVDDGGGMQTPGMSCGAAGDPRFERIAAKMRAEGLPEPAIERFGRYYGQIVRGERGFIPAGEIVPLDDVPSLESLEGYAARGRAELARAVVIRLNGGLGTTMGLERAKSLIVVRDGLTFLDIVVQQVLELRRRWGIRVPLVLMNSFHTDDDTLAHLARYPELAAGQEGVPCRFLQYRVPKILADTLEPLSWPADRSLEWCPPGHGEFYLAVELRGVLKALRARGYRYAFVANVDNLGATFEPKILGYVAERGLPFLMEVAERTLADRKGGHVARRRRDGRLILRESAQCPPEETTDFQDVPKYKYFNTNNLWLDLDALAEMLARENCGPDLPLICNRKTADPKDPNSPVVLHLETAIGAAISLFEGAGVLCVPRRRFTPVKTTEDLLVVRSDRFQLDGSWGLVPAAGCERPIPVRLDPDYYQRIADFEGRFSAGVPALKNCTALAVEGDVHFGRGVVLRGKVVLRHKGCGPVRIPDGAELCFPNGPDSASDH